MTPDLLEDCKAVWEKVEGSGELAMTVKNMEIWFQL
jgi:hypothetical protein